MINELSPIKRCDPWKQGFNPTCAGPYLYRNCCQNPSEAEMYSMGNVASAAQQWTVTKRPGSNTSGDGTIRLGCCARVQLLLEALSSSPRIPTGGHTVTDRGLIGCLVSPPGDKGSLIVPVKPHGVPARRWVKLTYKLSEKGQSTRRGGEGFLNRLLLRGISRSRVSP